MCGVAGLVMTTTGCGQTSGIGTVGGHELAVEH